MKLDLISFIFHHVFVKSFVLLSSVVFSGTLIGAVMGSEVSDRSHRLLRAHASGLVPRGRRGRSIRLQWELRQKCALLGRGGQKHVSTILVAV